MKGRDRMGKGNRPWWGRVTTILAYYRKGKPLTEKAMKVIADAIAETVALEDGAERMELVRVAWLEGGEPLDVAACRMMIPFYTAKRKADDFVELVARKLGYRKETKNG